jgi:hypothetical protein
MAAAQLDCDDWNHPEHDGGDVLDPVIEHEKLERRPDEQPLEQTEAY